MNSPPAVAPFDRFLAGLDDGMAASRPVAGPDGHPGPPSWLSQVTAVLYDGQSAADARSWALRVHGELDRLGGWVPLSVVHDWHAHGVVPLLTGAPAGQGGSPGPQREVADLHRRALSGGHVGEAEWNAALVPALRDVYRLAYAYEGAFAKAFAGAHAYAIDNDYGEERADEFARTYAELNTTAGARSFADANALAHAQAMARAFAAADERDHSGSWPFALVQAYAHACAHQGGPVSGGATAGHDDRLRAAYRELADRFADSLSRATA
ncbi:SpcZ [Streptomyces sp. NPDC093970]|uniref:SpcZ n=1 Tax=Streptomyces sp. NPDC093970 TaxID=3155076 RepID=UPI00343CA461